MRRIILILALCVPFSVLSISAKSNWKKGQADWAKIQLNESLSYDQAFGLVLELVSNKYEIDMISKDGGYIRSTWNFLLDKRGKKVKDQRCRIIIKFNHDKTQLQVKTESQKLKGDTWVDGVDETLSLQIKEDIRGALGY